MSIVATAHGWVGSRLAGVRAAALLLGLVLIAAGPPGRAEEPALVVLGDSLSAAYGIPLEDGWVARLERRLEEAGHGYRVVNASISGDTTRGGLARFEREAVELAPAVVIVALGGNDGLQGIPLLETRRNLEGIVRLAREAGARVLLLEIMLPPNYGPTYTEAFREMYTEVAEASGATLVPFFLDGVAVDPELMQADGIHPTAEAQPRMLENVWPYLEPYL